VAVFRAGKRIRQYACHAQNGPVRRGVQSLSPNHRPLRFAAI